MDFRAFDCREERLDSRAAEQIVSGSQCRKDVSRACSRQVAPGIRRNCAQHRTPFNSADSDERPAGQRPRGAELLSQVERDWRFLLTRSEDQDRSHASDSRAPRRDRPSSRRRRRLWRTRDMLQFVRKYGKPGRYFLHAAELKFTHPRTGAVMTIQSPLPPDLSSLLERIGK